MGKNRTLGSPLEIANITASLTTEPQIDVYAVHAAISSPVTVTLDPNAFNGDQVVVQDEAGNAATQTIVVAPGAGQTILGGSPDVSIVNDFAGVRLTYDFAATAWLAEYFETGAPSTLLNIPAATTPMLTGVACVAATATPITAALAFTPTGTKALVVADFSATAAIGTTSLTFAVVAGADTKEQQVGGIPLAGLAGATSVSGCLQLLVTGLTPGTPITITASLDPTGATVTTGTSGNLGGTTVIDLG